MLYWIHRLVHLTPIFRSIHLHHHTFIISHKTKWHWSNLFLFNDDWTSTLDLWLTEVIPTVLFSLITNQWWIGILYYIWAAFIQETIEHNEKFNIPVLTSGKWHLIHHRSAFNYGLFTSVWDIIFRTYTRVHK